MNQLQEQYQKHDFLNTESIEENDNTNIHFQPNQELKEKVKFQFGRYHEH